MANGKYRKQHIYKLENDQGIVIGDDQLKSHITQFYKNLFGTPDVSEITLMENQIMEIPQVSQEENDALISKFTETEVRDAVFQMEHNKAPGPDGFPVEFYQVF